MDELLLIGMIFSFLYSLTHSFIYPSIDSFSHRCLLRISSYVIRYIVLYYIVSPRSFVFSFPFLCLSVSVFLPMHE